MNDIKDKNYDVEIDDETKYKRVVGERTFFYQVAYLNKGKRNDLEFQIPLSQEQLPFRTGRYNWAGRNSLFQISKYNNLEIDRDINYAAIDFPIVPVPVPSSSSFLPEKKAA